MGCAKGLINAFLILAIIVMLAYAIAVLGAPE